jgi:hypothetical protein
MSGECHTDGFGIYLINEKGKELIGVRENDDKIAYTIEKDTVKICKKAFDRLKHLEALEIPSSVETIEENAFSNGPRDLHIINHSSALSYEDGFLIDQGTSTLILYTGNAEEIIIPPSVSILGRASFRSCLTKTIVLGDTVKEIHEDAFTTCRMERFSFTKWNAYVYFPQKDIRLRQHMLDGFGQNGIFDFARYDNDLLAGFIEDDRMKMIAARLKWPYHLTKENEEKFRTLIQKHLAAALQSIGSANDLFTLKLFLEDTLINENNIEESLEALHALDDLESYAYVSDYQNQHFNKKEFDFEI